MLKALVELDFRHMKVFVLPLYLVLLIAQS